jgi:hypothetical protein
MALAKVFTGWSLGLPGQPADRQPLPLGQPRLQRRRRHPHRPEADEAYPGQHSTGREAAVCRQAARGGDPAGRPQPSGGCARAGRAVQHPNVGPFIGRQLIQRLVTSAPQPGLRGARGAVLRQQRPGRARRPGAVVRAMLLDPEARGAPAPTSASCASRCCASRTGCARFGATRSAASTPWPGSSTTLVAAALLRRRRCSATSGPAMCRRTPSFSATRRHRPEFQIVNESTAAAWVNRPRPWPAGGLGWNGSSTRRQPTLAAAGALATASGNLDA